MVTLYTSPSCTSCRKARAWLQENNIPYKERNLFFLNHCQWMKLKQFFE